jgi:hypothetical protein
VLVTLPNDYQLVVSVPSPLCNCNLLVVFIRFLVLCQCVSIFVEAQKSEFKAFASFDGIGYRCSSNHKSLLFDTW